MKYSIATILPFATAVLAAQTAPVNKGCHSKPPGQVTSETLAFNSRGQCVDLCIKAQKPIAYVQKTSCICVDEAPTGSSLLADEQCDAPCPGFIADTCGGDNAYTVLETGYQAGFVQAQAPASSSATSAPPTATASSIPAADVVEYGCYASVDGESSTHPATFNSHGLCAQICRGQQKTTALLRDNECKCTNGKPVPKDKLAVNRCDIPCLGFSTQMCGGEKGYTVLDTGFAGAAQNSSASSSSTTATGSAAGTGGNGATSTSASPAPTSSIPVAGAISNREYTGGVVAGVFGLAALALL